MDTDDKNVRDAALLPIMDKIAEVSGPVRQTSTSSATRCRSTSSAAGCSTRKASAWMAAASTDPPAGCRSRHPAPCPWLWYVHPQPNPGADHLPLGGTKDNQLMLDDLTDEQT